MDLAAVGDNGEPLVLARMSAKLVWCRLGYEPTYAVRLPGIAPGTPAKASDVAAILHITRHFDEHETAPADAPEVLVHPRARRFSRL